MDLPGGVIFGYILLLFAVEQWIVIELFNAPKKYFITVVGCFLANYYFIFQLLYFLMQGD